MRVAACIRRDTLDVSRMVVKTHLLLDLEDLPLEFALDLRVLGLNPLQSLDSPLDGRRQRLQVSRRLADERSESVLHHVQQSRVLHWPAVQRIDVS